MRFMQLLRILRAHATLIAIILISTLVLAAVITAVTTPKYVATSSFLLNSSDNTPGSTAAPAAQLYPNYLATQLDLLSSQAVSLKVIDRLNLLNDPKARDRFLGASVAWEETLQQIKSSLRRAIEKILPSRDGDAADQSSPADDRFRLSDQLMKHATLRPSPDSSIIQVSYSASDPAAAAIAANAIVQAYIDTTLELSVNPARNSSTWFNSQVKQLSAKVDAARQELSAFQQRTGIIATDEANDVENTRLADLNAQLVAAQSQNHPAIQGLRDDLARAQAKLNELPPQLGSNHPEYRKAKSEVAALKESLAEQSANLIAELRGEIATQKQALLRSKQQRGQLATLKDAATTAQHSLDEVLQKSNDARMNAQVNQTNVSVIRTAVPPRRPTTPNLFFNFSLALAIGLLLGVGVALWREVTCRFVRSVDDLRDFLGVPILGVLHGGPRSSSGRARLQHSAPLLTAT